MKKDKLLASAHSLDALMGILGDYFASEVHLEALEAPRWQVCNTLGPVKGFYVIQGKGRWRLFREGRN